MGKALEESMVERFGPDPRVGVRRKPCEIDLRLHSRVLQQPNLNNSASFNRGGSIRALQGMTPPRKSAVSDFYCAFGYRCC